MIINGSDASGPFKKGREFNMYIARQCTRKMLQHHGVSLSKQHIVLVIVMAHKPQN